MYVYFLFHFMPEVNGTHWSFNTSSVINDRLGNHYRVIPVESVFCIKNNNNNESSAK